MWGRVSEWVCASVCGVPPPPTPPGVLWCPFPGFPSRSNLPVWFLWGSLRPFLGACEGNENVISVFVFVLVVEKQCWYLSQGRPDGTDSHCVPRRRPARQQKRYHFHLNVPVLDEAIKINFLKSQPLNTRLFNSPCEEMGSATESARACGEEQHLGILSCKVNEPLLLQNAMFTGKVGVGQTAVTKTWISGGHFLEHKWTRTAVRIYGHDNICTLEQNLKFYEAYLHHEPDSLS